MYPGLTSAQQQRWSHHCHIQRVSIGAVVWASPWLEFLSQLHVLGTTDAPRGSASRALHASTAQQWWLQRGQEKVCCLVIKTEFPPGTQLGNGAGEAAVEIYPPWGAADEGEHPPHHAGCSLSPVPGVRAADPGAAGAPTQHCQGSPRGGPGNEKLLHGQALLTRAQHGRDPTAASPPEKTAKQLPQGSPREREGELNPLLPGVGGKRKSNCSLSAINGSTVWSCSFALFPFLMDLGPLFLALTVQVFLSV